jgi:hypothetical protein
MKFKVGNEVIVKMSRLSETEEQCGLDTRMLQMRGKKYFITDTARAASIEEQKQPIYRLDNRFWFAEQDLEFVKEINTNIKTKSEKFNPENLVI